INTHVTLENQTGLRRKELDLKNNVLTFDQEIFVFTNSNKDMLIEEVTSSLNEIEYMSLAEFTEFSVHQLQGYKSGDYILAVVAKNPEDLLEKLLIAVEKMKNGDIFLSPDKEIYFSSRLQEEHKIAFLYPGQGSPVATDLGIIGELDSTLKFEKLDKYFLPKARENTELAQPLITTLGIEGTRFLNNLGLDGEYGLG